MSALLAVSQGYIFGHQPQYTIDLLRNFSASATKEIRMGTSASMDSKTRYARPGSYMVRGWDFFLDWVNLIRGGIYVGGEMHYVSIDIIEDYSNASDVISAYKVLADSFDFLFGPFSSALTDYAMDVSETAGKLMMATGASNTTVLKNRASSFGALPPSYTYVDSSMAVFTNNGTKTVAVMRDTDSSGCGDYYDSATAADKYNMTLFGYFLLEPTSPTYSQQVYDLAVQFKNAGVETVIGCTFSSLCYEVKYL